MIEIMSQHCEARSVKTSYVENVEFITPSHSFHDNTAFGGQLFAWMDSAAAISVMKYSGSKAVTVAVNGLFFLKPVKIGMIASIRAQIVAMHTTSCQVKVEVHTIEGRMLTSRLAAVGFFSMVALGPTEEPIRLPPMLDPQVIPDLDSSIAARLRLVGTDIARELRQS